MSGNSGNHANASSSGNQDREAADARFWALRNSGYTGPIDQDGYAVTDGPAYDILVALRAADPAQ